MEYRASVSFDQNALENQEKVESEVGKSQSQLQHESIQLCGEALHDEFEALWQAADDVWDQRQNDEGFSRYVSADFPAVLVSLLKLRGQCQTFLEVGSGLGVVTIMASRLGFDAFGIEAESVLVQQAKAFSKIYGADARFGTGTFVPEDFHWNPALVDVNRTIVDIPSGYDDLEMNLRDFQLVYAYPWPDEHELYQDIIRQFGNESALLLSYDTREGMQLVQFGDHSSEIAE